MTFTQETTLFGQPLQTSSVEVLSAAKTFGSQPNHHYVVLLKAGALPTVPSLLGNGAKYTFRNTTGSPINLAFTAGETIDGASSPVALASNSQTTIVSEVSAAAGWTLLAFSPPSGALVGTTDTQTLPNKTLTAPVINGTVTGTGVAAASTASTLAQRDAQANLLADAFIPGFTTQATAAGTTALTVDSTEVQEFTGSTTQTVTMPTTGIVAGQRFTVINNSTGSVTVNGSAGGGIATLSAGYSLTVIARINAPTSGFSHWSILSLLSMSATFIDKASTANTVAQRSGSANLGADAFIPGFATQATAAGTTVLTSDSVEVQAFTGSTTQTVTLPTSGILAGWRYTIINNSSGAVTVNSSGANLVKTVAAGASSVVTALVATPTTAAHWFGS